MRLLIIALEIPPCVAIGARRPYQWSRHLLEMGHEVSILTSDHGDEGDLEAWDKIHMPEGLRLFRVPCSDYDYSSNSLLRWLQFFFSYVGDKWDRGWRLPVSERWGQIIDEAKPDVVVVTVPFLCFVH